MTLNESGAMYQKPLENVLQKLKQSVQEIGTKNLNGTQLDLQIKYTQFFMKPKEQMLTY